jgi:hypothetical protein
MPKLEPGSVTVTDNVPYRSVELDHPPNKTWWKQAIID